MNTLAVVLAVALCAISAQAYSDSDYIHPHIIRGTNARVGEFPWQGSLQRFGGHNCGCVVISSRWVVTAGHCVGSQVGLKVVLGLHNQRDMQTGAPRAYDVERIVVHPGWTGRVGSTDAGLIRVTQAIQMGQYVRAIAMANNNDNFVGQQCTISGWGVTTEGGGSIPRTLQRVNVPVMSTAQCRTRFSIVNDGHICVGGQGAGGSCNGDSGGPLVCQGKLAGVTSFGIRGCYTRWPSVYTRIGYVRTWIMRTAGV